MIRLDGVSHSYPGLAAPVLDDVSLVVGRGEHLALVGQSGAGKSTLLRVLNLLVRPTRGVVEVDGTKLTELDDEDLAVARRDVGMVFQHFALLSRRTVRDNVALPLELAGWSRPRIGQRVSELLERVGLVDKAAAFPAQLSGGQRQRVGIARALAHGPRVLLCDEPTSALDAATTGQVVTLLKELSADSGLTLVVVTHQLDVARALADRVGVLDRGRLVELRGSADFFAAPGSPAGRRLVGRTQTTPLPGPLLFEARSRSGIGDSTLLNVSIGPATPRPAVIETLVSRFGLSVDVVGAHLEPVGVHPIGQLVAVVRGDPKRIEQALDALRAQHVDVEVMGHVGDAA